MEDVKERLPVEQDYHLAADCTFTVCLSQSEIMERIVTEISRYEIRGTGVNHDVLSVYVCVCVSFVFTTEGDTSLIINRVDTNREMYER